MMSFSLQRRPLLRLTSFVARPKMLTPLQLAFFGTRPGGGSSWSFPKHKELLTEDFYDYEDG